MLGSKVFGAGVQGLAVQAICQDVTASISAAGTNQSTATALTSADNEVTTTASGTGVVLPSAATAGDTVTVFNAGANPLKVYPVSGQKINSLPTNQAVILATNTGCLFKMVSTTRWFGVLSA